MRFMEFMPQWYFLFGKITWYFLYCAHRTSSNLMSFSGFKALKKGFKMAQKTFLTSSDLESYIHLTIKGNFSKYGNFQIWKWWNGESNLCNYEQNGSFRFSNFWIFYLIRKVWNFVFLAKWNQNLKMPKSQKWNSIQNCILNHMNQSKCLQVVVGL